MYQALYRKYRPQVFEDVVGLPHVTRTLKTEVMSGRIAHAYLFTGSRGTGKTTCARILAKAINCLRPVDGDPCCECEACRKIDSGLCMDVTEIDAASNNGVDSIRDLREEAAFTPAELKARVYIIDEVHMLSQAAFNALLKTLEEPPAYVYFVLATTEVQKLPATILSRCQRFDFHRIPNDAISARIRYIAGQEGMNITDDAADMIARVCDGGMRDAVSLLDQCGSYGDVTAETVTKAAGLADKSYLLDLVSRILSHDTGAAIAAVDELYRQSCDMEQLCRELIHSYRDMMLLKVSKSDEGVKADAVTLARTKELAGDYTLENIIYVLDKLQLTRERMRYSSDRLVDMEIAMVRLCEPSLDDGNTALAARIGELERAVANGVTVTVPSPVGEPKVPTPKAEKPVSPRPVEERPCPAPSGNVEKKTTSAPKPVTQWPEIIDELARTNPVAAGFLQAAKVVREGDRLLISGVIAFVEDDFRHNGPMKTSLEAAASHVLGNPVVAALVGGMPPARKETVKEEDPLQNLLNRARDAGIPVEGDGS